MPIFFADNHISWFVHAIGSVRQANWLSGSRHMVDKFILNLFQLERNYCHGGILMLGLFHCLVDCTSHDGYPWLIW
jgi:hypothetical protein